MSIDLDIQNYALKIMLSIFLLTHPVSFHAEIYSCTCAGIISCDMRTYGRGALYAPRIALEEKEERKGREDTD